MRRPIGLDLNGWRDHGCRDWSADDPDVRLDAPVRLEGGSRSVIVEHGALRVGGPEAILSPIGRGGGWGEIGTVSKRRYLADHWSDLERGEPGPSFDGDMQAAAAALSHLASRRVLCIPDHSGFGEAQQKRLLSAFGSRRDSRPVLVWRSVALVLGLLDAGTLTGAQDGMRVACLIHGSAGLERQVLTLRRLADHPEWLAPERAGAGEVVCPMLSLSGLLRTARSAVASANPVWDERKTDVPRMASDLLFQEDAPEDAEIIRRENGDWMKLQAPSGFSALGGLADADELSIQADCTVVLSPLARRHKVALEALLAPGFGGGRLIFAEPGVAARGALFAARRMERGIAHYLDRLDPVAMVVMRRGGPTFEDLIPSDASVPGDREYVSKPLTGFIWSAGMKAVHFYLRKGATEVRTWHVTVDVAPERDEGLVVQLRQTPAQGWATLSVTAETWEALRREPIRLDWGSLTVEARTEDEILEVLRGPRPAIPERIRYEALLGLWDGSLRSPGLAAVLQSFKPGDPGSLTALKDAVSRPWTRPPSQPAKRPGPFFAVSTDGELPDGLEQKVRDAFARTISHLAEELLLRIRTPSLQVLNNDALACLTWIFAACPGAVRDEVILAFEAWLRTGNHKLLQPRQAGRVVVHGLGRISADRQTLGWLLPKLIALLPRTTVLAWTMHECGFSIARSDNRSTHSC